MTRTKSIMAVFAALAASTPAFAHTGDHSASIFANIIHWLSSPTHSLFALVSGLIIVGGTVAFTRKKRA